VAFWFRRAESVEFFAKSLRCQVEITLCGCQANLSHVNRECREHSIQIGLVPDPRRNSVDSEACTQIMHSRLINGVIVTSDSCSTAYPLEDAIQSPSYDLGSIDLGKEGFRMSSLIRRGPL